MKSNRINSFVAMLSVAVVLLSFIPRSIAADNLKTLNKKEINTLIATAKTPAQHRRIASYYLQEAQRLSTASKFHEAMAKSYEAQPLPFEAKHPYGTLGVSHCRYWAELDLKQAKEAEALAALHEDMAKAAEHK
jgi:hypothetical protein